ncbi:MAG: hypothetical protein Q7U78_01145 [Gallionella sp.]|nr:hypothetical protein [Gallionella sp.]
MRLAGWILLLSVMLPVGVQAAGQDTSVESAPEKALSTPAASPAHGKKKAVRSNKSKPASGKVAPKAKVKLDAITESPDGSTDQSVQLKGVRG